MAVILADIADQHGLDLEDGALVFTTIWKYDAPELGAVVEHQIPKGAGFLSAQTQFSVKAQILISRPMMWFAVDADAPRETRRFTSVGTAQPLSDMDVAYCGTLQLGYLALHILELLDDSDDESEP